MMKAMFYEVLENNSVKCTLCPHNCLIASGKVGICKVRKNQEGKLIAEVYSHPSAVHIDPIEKKPFYHFLPGSTALSIGTVGCNMACTHCQNYDISTASLGDEALIEIDEIVRQAVLHGCRSIAYTYNEPTIFYEFMYDTAKLAKRKGIKNVMVSNGFINEAPLRKIAPLIDAANIDLKSFSDGFYKEVCKASLNPVLKTLKLLKELGVWTEVTTLIIPDHNDSSEEMKSIATWINENLGKETPLHITRFFPYYKMMDVPVTPIETLRRLEAIAKKHLDYVYVGNIGKEPQLICPKCKKEIKRRGFDGRCPCGNEIPGIWGKS